MRFPVIDLSATFPVFAFNYLPSVLWCCWLGDRKGIRPVKNLSGGVLAWLSVWSEMQTCIWPSWCHSHSLSLASVKSRLVLPFWYQLTWVVPEKGPLNGCVLTFVEKCISSQARSHIHYDQTSESDLSVVSRNKCSDLPWLSVDTTKMLCLQYPLFYWQTVQLLSESIRDYGLVTARTGIDG